ncbi:MAG: YiiX/YebB-like N1pC/P60 family cysteine hydrolase [Woeseiaceae bacterium]|nr:YiiX/YebB-like N1pC/P60 family cysteine hydrolase [Woeseiaceae bacterium]
MIKGFAITLRGLLDSAQSIESDVPSSERLQRIIERGVFRPSEDEAIGFWFARVLTTRDNLRRLIEDLTELVDKPTDRLGEDELGLFLVGYAAACTLVRIDRLLLFRIATHTLIQRKLNEPFPEYRIPGGQYTAIYSWFVDHANAVAMLNAMRFAKKRRRQIRALEDDPDIGFIVRQLSELESSLNPSIRHYVRIAWEYVSHKWRRRGKAGAESLLAAILEGAGRAASEFSVKDNKRVTDEIRTEIADILEPGDVLVTRHAIALTNLFLPGFWPHAAFYIGTPEQRSALGVDVDEARADLWTGDVCTLEALKDGVRLRPLSETLSVDSFVVLRPAAQPATIRQAIERAVVHEGKQYNFDFDFFTSDRMVCTEVVYRAYDGIGDLRFPLQERGGRKTFSAEDLLDYALDSGVFEPKAIFGVLGCEDRIAFGDSVRELLIGSYREAE